LVKSLAYTVDPLLPGLTYDELASQRFLEGIGIAVKRSDGSPTTYKDLSADEVSKLATALIKHLLMKGFSPQSANALFGLIYEFIHEPEGSSLRYAHDFAQMLNACGRLRKHGVGLAIGLGDRGKLLSQAEAISLEYRRRLAQYLSLLRNDSSYVRILNNVQVMDMRNIVDERVLGSHSLHSHFVLHLRRIQAPDIGGPLDQGQGKGVGSHARSFIEAGGQLRPYNQDGGRASRR
jgi:RecJ-like exonuclease